MWRLQSSAVFARCPSSRTSYIQLQQKYYGVYLPHKMCTLLKQQSPPHIHKSDMLTLTLSEKITTNENYSVSKKDNIISATYISLD
jgi:hypothetical protein